MRLVYEATQREVQIGDNVNLDGVMVTVEYFRKPTSPNSSGKVTIKTKEGHQRELYTHVLGMKWIEREDRGE